MNYLSWEQQAPRVHPRESKRIVVKWEGITATSTVGGGSKPLIGIKVGADLGILFPMSEGTAMRIEIASEISPHA